MNEPLGSFLASWPVLVHALTNPLISAPVRSALVGVSSASLASPPLPVMENRWFHRSGRLTSKATSGAIVPVTRQCCGVSAVAATTRAAIDTMPSALNDDRLSQGLDGVASATEYWDAALLALAKACAAAGDADAH